MLPQIIGDVVPKGRVLHTAMGVPNNDREARGRGNVGRTGMPQVSMPEQYGARPRSEFSGWLRRDVREQVLAATGDIPVAAIHLFGVF